VAKRDELLRLFDLADRKGFDVTQSTMRNHVRLIGPDGEIVKNKNGGAAFSYGGMSRPLLKIARQALPVDEAMRPRSAAQV
jgi:hypothetical protein